jgi:UDP-perosamine 4-acetyltransferase
MTPPVIVLGAGGHAKVVIEALHRSSVAILGIVDNDPARVGEKLLGVPVIGEDDAVLLHPADSVRLVNALGSVGVSKGRRILFQKMKEKGYYFYLVVHPSAVIAEDVVLSEGAQVMAGAVIQPGTHIGRNAIVNTRASIDHDCRIGDHVHVAPGATLSGGVAVGSGAHIGTGATIIQGITIGSDSMVAAGAVVVRDVADGTTVKGVPARGMDR